jgi:hypothetical protein
MGQSFSLGIILAAKLPLKIRMFLWQVCNDKIQFVDQLARKNWVCPTDCKLCGQYESAEYIFAQCMLAKLGWSILRDVLE